MGPNVTEALPDDALVVRGGRNAPEQVEKAFATHPGGFTGVSAASAPGLAVGDLASGVRAQRIGTTTVGRVRAAGGDVIRTAGSGLHHATLIGLTAEQISRLLTPSEPNRNPARTAVVGIAVPLPPVYADFGNADADGRIRLNCVGAILDLARHGIRLSDGLSLTLRDDDVQAEGVVAFSATERVWVAEINGKNRELADTDEHRPI